jgi:SAM-dependent methyltransferase
MAHAAQREFVNRLAQGLGCFFNNCKVLEVGSLDINGSIRDSFNGCEYIGLDVAKGRGVDVVCEAQKYDATDASFDHIISCEAMEHNPYWQETITNMIRMCRRGGLVTITCASKGRREHGTSRLQPKDSPLTVRKGWDYYHNLAEHDLRRAFDLDQLFSDYLIFTNWTAFDLYFAGIKKGQSEITPELFTKASESIGRFVREQNGLKSAKYRSIVCENLGEPVFNTLRKLSSITNSKALIYLHG